MLISRYSEYYGLATLVQLLKIALFFYWNQLIGSIIVTRKYFSFLLIEAASLFLLALLHVPYHQMNFPSLLLVLFHYFLQFHCLFDEELHDMEMLILFLHCFKGNLIQIRFFSKTLICLPIDLHRLPHPILVLKWNYDFTLNHYNSLVQHQKVSFHVLSNFIQ